MHSVSLAVTAMWAGAALLAGVAGAQDLPDPTRPPPGLGQGGIYTAPSVESGPALQSILISPQRKVAVISGKAMQVGDKIGGAQLVTIGDNEVVLRSGSGMQVLRLYPSLKNASSSSNQGGQESLKQDLGK